MFVKSLMQLCFLECINPFSVIFPLTCYNQAVVALFVVTGLLWIGGASLSRPCTLIAK